MASVVKTEGSGILADCNLKNLSDELKKTIHALEYVKGGQVGTSKYHAR